MGNPGGIERRAFLTGMLGAASLALAGCASDPILTSVAEGFAANRKARKQAYTPEAIRKLPYATMGVRVGKSRQALVVLARNVNDDLHWVSTNKVLFVTRHGRLIRTNGLIKDVRTTRFGSSDPVQTGLQNISRDESLIRFMDLRPARDQDQDVPATSVFRVKEEGVITILGRPQPVLRVEEHVSVWRWNWHVNNQYWVDLADGFVWRSRQHLVPQLEELELEIFKPAKRA